MPRPGLAIIRKSRMSERIESVLGQLETLYGMAIDKSARKNLGRAITSTKNALKTYEHGNRKSPHPIPQQQARRDRERNPQKARYAWHG